MDFLPYIHNLFCSEDIDVTGISSEVNVTGISASIDVTRGSSFAVNDTVYEVENDSVILKRDADKYRNPDDSDSESIYSSDSDEVALR